MKQVIYLIKVEAVKDDFGSMTDNEIKELYAKYPSLVLRFDNLYDFANDWNLNYYDMFDPDFSYMRIIEEEV